MTIASRLIRIVTIAVALTLIVSAISTQIFVQDHGKDLVQLRESVEGDAQQITCRELAIPYLTRILSPLLGLSLLLIIATIGTTLSMRNKEKNLFIDKGGFGILVGTATAIVFVVIQIWEPEYSLLLCLL